MKKACKNCRLLVEGQNCPNCKGNQFSDSWKGKIAILDPINSEIAKKLDIPIKGEYAIKL
ncbi:DNA-directed RNA polymerase subunit E'' [archaeon]|jgi:DNA-directed RNA polymerase subunit E"|nr:DNA-directed RNA polymerase subunit E'' [archaeon]MBT6824332.1 DNA-directed RNA polymerase subunit E'' [archaeon]MBT7106882.1 DNA-directed RNA polymerase subunit E'' [archaeon]MBT7297434.1 DNA-directed RNA polymerase subunit E'' [archaeon]